MWSSLISPHEGPCHWSDVSLTLHPTNTNKQKKIPEGKFMSVQFVYFQAQNKVGNNKDHVVNVVKVLKLTKSSGK